MSLDVQAQLEMRHNPYIKGRIVLKNDSIKFGFVKLDASAFRVRYKATEEQKSKEKIDAKTIESIVIVTPSGGERTFYYKVTDQDKFPKFVELLSTGKYDLYLYSPNEASLYYKDVDRSNVSDYLAYTRDMEGLGHYSVEEIRKEVAKIVSPKYLLDLKSSDPLYFIYSNRKLRKNAPNYFKDCPSLVSRIESKELNLDDILKIIDLYNNCSKN